jgi:hypothetical protein
MTFWSLNENQRRMLYILNTRRAIMIQLFSAKMISYENEIIGMHYVS